MRIAYVTETYPPEVNGVALTVQRCVRHMRRAGHSVLLVRPALPGERSGRDAQEWRTHGMRIPMYPDLRMGLASAPALRRALGDFAPELVHVATQGPLGRAAVAAARRLGVAVTSDFRTNFHVYCAHYGFAFARGLVMQYLRGFHNRTAATFVPCRALQAELQQQGLQRVEVMSRGVDARLFSPAHRRPQLRRLWNAADSAPVLLCVGRLAREKNVPLALRAFDAVLARRPDARMVVVGDGPLRRGLQAGHPHVHFVGVQRGSELAAHYASADVFLFPSLSETFGNVTLEALASGLAVVAFDVAAAGELIRDGRNGVLVRAGDGDAFEQAACSAAGGDLGAIRARARQTALANDWEPVLHRFEMRLAELAQPIEGFGHASLA
ncbi:MAG TPA: glycosyltransferase family 1 protein [Burkholderiaceae bacterium]